MELTIGGINCELSPKTKEEKLKKIEALARIPENAFERFLVGELRELAKGLVRKIRVPKTELVEQLKEITKDKRKELAARAAQAVSDLASMKINVEDIVLLLNTSEDPGDVAELLFANYQTRFAPGTISKLITPAINKLLSNNPNLDTNKAVLFKHKWMELVRPITNGINKSYQSNVVQKQQNLNFVDHNSILEFIEATLLAVTAGKNPNWVAVVFALVGATGRRPCEILSTKSSFSPIQGEPNMLLFDGQAKTKNRQDVGAYTIPTLVEADLCLAGLQYLEQVGKRTDCLHSQVNRRISTSFTTDLPKTVRESLAKTGLQRPYDFRHFYACYLLESFVQCPGRPPVSSRVFLSRLLGHGSNDIHTANSYDSMCIRLTLSPEEQEEFTALWYKIFSC